MRGSARTDIRVRFMKSVKYPIGAIAAYGPDNKLATKLVVAVFKTPGRKVPAFPCGSGKKYKKCCGARV